MLLLRRRVGESIVIGDGIRITVSEVRGGTVRLAIEAPHELPVYRAELVESLGGENERALMRRSVQPPPASIPTPGLSDPTITFPGGLLGLGSHKEFLLYDVDEESRMLAAKDDANLRLWLTSPTLIDPDYPLQRALSRYPFGEEEVVVAVVVTRPADGSTPTANMAAPLLIGVESRRAVQVILDDERLALRAPLAASSAQTIEVRCG